MNSVIVAFSGEIGSGKTTLSDAVAKSLGWPRVSFGDYVRQVARKRGISQTRESLQKVGVSLIDEGWEAFCRSVLAQVHWTAGQSLIVDGVRHVEALQALGQITTPSTVLLVLVQLSARERESRLAEKGCTTKQVNRWASHPTEIQIQTTLPEIADFIVDASLPLEDGVRMIENWIRCYKDEEPEKRCL